VGLRTEIIVNLALLMGAAMVFVGLLLIKVSENELVAQRLAAARGTAEILASFAVAPLSSSAGGKASGNEEVQNLLAALPATSGIDAWWLVDSRLRPLTGTAGRRRADALPAPVFESDIRFAVEPRTELHYPPRWIPFQEPDVSYLDVSAPVRKGGQFLGALQLRFSLDDVRSRVDRTQRLFFVYVLLYGLVLILFGVYFLGRTVVRPVRRLLRATTEVSGGNLEESLPVEGPVEIAELAGSFNRMVEALRESRQQTQHHIRSLEQANSALRDTRRELLLSARMASVGHLAAGMAHEVGNPLGAMIGYLELLRQQLDSPADRDLVERTLVEAERIDYLVRDLLDFAAPAKSAGTPADPLETLEETRLLLSRQGKFEELELETELPPVLPRVGLSSKRLLQVLVNLLLNACDATPPGGILRLTAESRDATVVLGVADSGAGIPEKVLEDIFDPFFSTKPEGKGRGLGLAICHRLVAEAGGRIEVASKAGQGTVFTIILPIAEEDDAQ